MPRTHVNRTKLNMIQTANEKKINTEKIKTHAALLDHVAPYTLGCTFIYI